ncbi:MAG: flagellar export protein FliJ [Leptospira sp.]|nr:flagellar export protein FliJ [Leptospira sp.]
MKKFQFRLHPLLTLKKRKEDEEIRNFSTIVSEINLLKDEQDNLNKEISSLGTGISERIGKSMNIRDYSEYIDISRYLNLKISNLEKDIQSKQPNLDLARIRLNEASKEKKILEILRDNEYKKYKKKLQKVEKTELEEYITVSHFLNQDSVDLEKKTNDKKTLEEWEDWERREFDKEETTEDKPELTEYEKLQQYYDSFNK